MRHDGFGAVEAIGGPGGGHLGLYPYVAASVGLPVAGVSIIPGVGVEYSPDASRWGFVGTVAIEKPLTEKVAVDVLVSATHDQSSMQWSEAVFSVGAGVALSIATEHVAIAPMLSVSAAIDGSGWCVAPGVNVAHVF